MKKFLFVSSLAFSVTLAVVVGIRMSPDALAVIIALVSGVLASVPTSVILVWVLRQRDKQIEAQLNQGRPGHYPPVVVVNRGPVGMAIRISPRCYRQLQPPPARVILK